MKNRDVVVKYGNNEYMWLKNNWVALNNNLTVNTALAQKLSILAIKEGLLTLEEITNK